MIEAIDKLISKRNKLLELYHSLFDSEGNVLISDMSRVQNISAEIKCINYCVNLLGEK